MAQPPAEPSFDKGRFPGVPWLPKLWETLLPFFRETSAALARQLTYKDNFSSVVVEGESRPVHIHPASGDASILFIATGVVRASWVQVLAEPLPDAGADPGLVQVLPVWVATNEGGQTGVKLLRLPGLTAGRRYRIGVTVLGG